MQNFITCNACKSEVQGNSLMVCPNCGNFVCDKCGEKNGNLCPHCFEQLSKLN